MAYVQEKCGKDGKKLVDTLLAIANNPKSSDRDRITAIGELMDRGWNKPTQGMYIADEMRPLVIDVVTDADVQQRRDETD